jgi:sec-independent protein translocase protein TatB
MFDLSWGELLVIGVVALVAIGPKELPTVMRTVGQWTAKLRRMAAEFQSQFQEAMREAELADLKKQVDDVTREVRSYGTFDPISDVRRELESTQSQIENAMAAKPAPESAPPAPAAESVAPAIESATEAAPASAPSAPPNGAVPERAATQTSSDTSAGAVEAVEGKPT